MKSQQLLPVVSILACGTAVQAAEKPNILWLTYEDTSPQFIGCYGNEASKTPAMDELANDANGLRFNYAFSNSTVSSASRSCIITGMDVNRLGTGNHRYERTVPSDVHGFPYYLRQAGYYTSNNYKTDYNISNPYFISSAWNESSGSAHWNKRGSASTPFFSVFNINYSHQSYTTQQSYKYYLDNVYANLDASRRSDEDQVVIPPYYYADEEMKLLMTRVHNCINYTDQIIEYRLKELKDAGLMDNTIIFIFSDHGQGIPRGKACALGLGYRVPFVVWFPDKWKHLNPFESNVVDDTQICFEDLAPTVLTLAGVDVPENMTGTPFLGDGELESREYIYGQRNRIDDTPGFERSVMKDKFIYTRVFTPFYPFVKNQGYIYNSDLMYHYRKNKYWDNLSQVQLEPYQPRMTEYLYNLEDDKWELNNLAYNPEYADLVEELRGAMQEHCVKVKDIGFIPENEMGVRSAGTTPYAIRENYDIEKVVETAMMVGEKTPMSTLLERLSDTDPIVRYWAAVAIYAKGEQAAEYHTQLKSAMESETMGETKIELAAFIRKFCADESGADLLLDYVKGTNPLLAHAAVVKLQDLGEDIVKYKTDIYSLKTTWATNDKTYTVSPALNTAVVMISEFNKAPFSDELDTKLLFKIRNGQTLGYIHPAAETGVEGSMIQTLLYNQATTFQIVQGDKGYKLLDESGEYALMIDGESNGSKISMAPVEDSSLAQEWLIEPYRLGYFLTSCKSDKPLQVNGQSKLEDAVIAQWDWNGNYHFVWLLLSQGESGVDDVIASTSGDSLIQAVYPNPVAAGCAVNVTINLASKSSVKTKLYSLSGSAVYDATEQMLLDAGKYRFQISDKALASVSKGLYLLSVTSVDEKTKQVQKGTQLIKID